MGPESQDQAEAFTQLYNGFYHALKSYLRRRGCGSHTAEDLVHDTFLRLWQYRHRLERLDTAYPLLKRFARQRQMAEARKNIPTLAPQETEQVKGLIEEPVFELECREVDSLVRQAIENLPDRVRNAFKAREYEVQLLREIAGQQKVTREGARQRIQAAARELRKRLPGRQSMIRS